MELYSAMFSEVFSVPPDLAQRSRQILRYGPPSLLAVHNQIRAVMRAVRLEHGYVNEILISSNVDLLTIGHYHHQRKPVAWFYFGEFPESQGSVIGLMPRGDRIRAFWPTYRDDTTVFGPPKSFPRDQRARVLHTIAHGFIEKVF